MKKTFKILMALVAVAILTACGGSSTPSSENENENDNLTTCTFEQVGELSSNSATGNIACSDADGIRNTDEFPAVVTVNSVEYRLNFADNVTSFDENVTVTGLSEDTNTSASAVLYVVNGESGEVDMLSVGTTNLETNLAPDTVKPVITVTGGTTTLTVGGVYTAPTVTASDDVDGDITASIVVGGDTVNPDAVGTYTVTYNVSDESGNAATQKTHTVVVSTVPISTPTISMANQTVNDNGGGLATVLPAPSVTGVTANAVYSITTGVAGLTINSATGVMTYDKNLDSDTNESHSITIKVTNPDGGTSSATFTLNIVDNL